MQISSIKVYVGFCFIPVLKLTTPVNFQSINNHQSFTSRLQINLSYSVDATREPSHSTPSDYLQWEWIASPWRERRRREDMKSSGLSGANIDFRLDALPNAYVSYCSGLVRFAKDCAEPILIYSVPTRGLVWGTHTVICYFIHICGRPYTS